MRNLSISELISVSGATIVNSLPVGTNICGVTTQTVDSQTGVITTTLLYAWKATKGGGSYIGYWHENTPFYFNENHYSSMPEISTNSYVHYDWSGQSF
jgi:hypothetical protein